MSANAALDPLFEALTEGVCVLDSERRIVRYNGRFLAVTGIPADVLRPGERLAGALAWLTLHGEFATPAQREDVVAKFRAAGSAPFSYRRERRDGSFFEMRGRPLADGGFALVAEDLTEQRRAESAVRASDARMRQAFARAAVAINICDADGRYLEANDAFCKMVGYSLAELHELSFETITHPDDIALDKSFHLDSFAGDDDCHVFEKRYIHKNGSTVWTKLSVTMMRDEEGWPTNTVALIEDITAQKRALESKRETETLLARALESVSEGFALFDPSGRLAVMNRHYRGYFPGGDEWIRLGMTFEEITRKGIERGAYRLPPGLSDDDFLRERLATRARSEATVFQTSEGRWLRAHDYRTPDGSVVALRSDVTELMKRSQALADSEERFRSLTNNLPGVVFTVELDPKSGQRRLTYLGDTLPTALGIDRAAALRGEIGLVHSMPPEDAEAYLAAMATSARDLTPMSIDVRFTGGPKPQWTRIAATPRRLANGVVRWDGIGLDVTELTERTQALRESEGRFRSLANNLPGVVFTFEANMATGMRRMTYLSDAFRSVIGIDRDKVLAGELKLADFMAADDKPRFLAAMTESAANLTPMNLDLRFVVEGQPPRWTQLAATPHHLPDGTVRWDGIALDITQQRATEEQLRQGFKMEALGQLTGGIAHDFNNVLTVMVGSAELLQDTVEESAVDEDTRQLVKNIMMAGAQGADLTRRLLAFARRQPLKPESLDINRLMADITPLMERALGGGIEVILEPATSRCAASVDRSQLENAVLNLATNARDAMPGGGRVAISTALVSLDTAQAALIGGITAGDYVRISVADQGTGMAPEVIARASEPFFTTKPEGKGTGLGLSMVYGFVRQSGGAMSIDSTPGQGTTIHLYLPRITEDCAGAGARGRTRSAPGGSETILVVEDEATVRDTLSRMLGNLGYRVTGAATGQEALTALSARADIDLLFTGLAMPGGLDGRALAAAARKRRPNLRVLYTSGNSEQSINLHGHLEPETPLLEKPFTLDDLARSVRRALT